MKDEQRTKKQPIPARGTWLYIAGMFVMLCILEWLNEIVDFPHLLLGAPRTPINWHEASIEMVLIAGVGLLVVLRLVRDITERKRAEDALRQRTAQLEALRQVELEITIQLDLDTLLHSIVSRAIELVGGASGGLYLYRPNRDVLEWDVSIGPDQVPVGTVLHWGEGLAGKVWETGEPLIVDDYQQWDGRAASYDGYPWTAVVGVPVRWGEEFLGVLDVLADPPRTFSSADAELLSLFATQAAIAIRNARLYEAERRRIAELEALRQASLHLISTLELQPVLETILDYTLELVAAYDAHIFLYDGKRLAFGAALWGDGRQQKPYAEPRPQGLTYTVARSGERIAVPDVNSHPLFRDYQWGGAIVGLPLRIGERVVGVMTVAFQRPHAFDESELRVLGLLADQAAIAIENARLFGEAQQRVAELEALQHTSLQITSSLDPSAVLDTIAQSALSLVGATNCHIYLYDEASETFTFGTALWEDGRREAAVKVPRRDGLTATVAQGSQAIVINDAPHHPLYATPEAQNWDVQAIAGFPLKRVGRVLGVFTIAFLEPHTFSEEELRVLGLLADQAAIAIENARLYSVEKRQAKESSALLEVARTVSTTLDLTQVLQLIAKKTAATCNVDRCSILLLDEEGRRLIPLMSQFSSGRVDKELWGVFKDRTYVETIDEVPALKELIKDRTPTIFDGNSLSLLPPRWIEPFDIKSLLATPLVSKDRVIGVMTLDYTEEGKSFSDEQVALVTTIASQAAMAIENARLFEEAERLKAFNESIVQGVAEAILIEDDQGILTFANPAAEELLGYTSEELIGRHWKSIVPDEQVDKVQQELAKRPRAIESRYETGLLSKEGQVIPVIVSARPLFEDGQFVGVLTAFTDITERKWMEEKLAHIATHDTLTGLRNRLGFFTLAEQQLKIADRTKTKLSLLFADFDHLKQINDTFGHREGDRALIETANILKETLRESDIIGRIGGDEFVVLATETDAASTKILATRLQENLEARNARGDLCYELSLSVGLAYYDPENPCSIEELLARADRAMYEKKRDTQKA
jgi:diguanylate cyclase (GGDEF)-like protein/PAS domain S-box-containing protein